jgi:hypothetical protein
LVDQVVFPEGALDLAGGRAHGDGRGLGGRLHRESAFLCLAACCTNSGAERFICFL